MSLLKYHEENTQILEKLDSFLVSTYKALSEERKYLIELMLGKNMTSEDELILNAKYMRNSIQSDFIFKILMMITDLKSKAGGENNG